ncbi:MAG TPA: class I SAM-dependent methyltransferase [Caulobacteraceae bacterium]
MKLSNILLALRDDGVLSVALRAGRAVLPRSELRRLGALALIDGKTGLEIGGPSAAFRRLGPFPAYLAAARIDNCNFAPVTLWEGEIAEGRTFRFNPRRAPGQQFVGEATDLSFIAADSYDFVLSSHMIEHCANPLRALIEWRRILKPGGALILVAPHKDGTFDHRRPVVTIEHLVADYEGEVDESDATHVEEVLALHDISRDVDGGDFEAFEARTLRWRENRCLHHHVFDTHLAGEMVGRAGFRVTRAERTGPADILVVAINPPFSPASAGSGRPPGR